MHLHLYTTCKTLPSLSQSTQPTQKIIHEEEEERKNRKRI
jgi:hypothetical protein